MDLRNKIEKLMIESSIGLTKVSSHLKYRFIQPVSPLVSIIIVTFNNIGYTRFCISSIYTKTFQPGFELIIVENASTDGTKEYLYTLKRKDRNVNIIINDKIGLLDERFSVGMFEDDDYSMRIKKAGFKVICAEDVFIHHFGGTSFSKLHPDEYYKIFEENRKKYELKWGIEWT